MIVREIVKKNIYNIKTLWKSGNVVQNSIDYRVNSEFNMPKNKKCTWNSPIIGTENESIPTFMPNVGGKDIDGVQICCGKFIWTP